MARLINAALQLLLLLALLLRPAGANAAGQDLVDTILARDAVVFERGFNDCDIDALEDAVSDSLEFFHDQSGITRGLEDFLATTRNNICSLDYRPRRELLPASTEVFPLHDNGRLYGAIQRGVHSFHALYPDGREELTSVARFTHLWLLDEEGRWKLAKVLSFDHQSPDEADRLLRKGLPDNRIRLITDREGPSRAF